MDWRHGNAALLSMTRILTRNVKPKRDHVRMENVLNGDHGQFGVHARLHVGNLEETHQHMRDIDVGILKQVLELIAMLIMNQLHVNVIQKNANSKEVCSDNPNQCTACFDLYDKCDRIPVSFCTDRRFESKVKLQIILKKHGVSITVIWDFLVGFEVFLNGELSNIQEVR